MSTRDRSPILRRAGHHGQRAQGPLPARWATHRRGSRRRPPGHPRRPGRPGHGGAWTVARWLRYWLTLAEPHLRLSTLHGYRDYVDRYLIPSIGRITLADLTGNRLQACFNILARQRTRKGTLIAASTVDRVRATLRSALNAAVREGLIASNPLAHVRLDKPVRPHPVIWTDERVEAWRRDGIRPPVAVWTLRQLVTFLLGVENDRLAALWWLIALRGLRRGEAAALDRDDLDSEARELTISRQLIALPGELYCGPSKSRASLRTIAWTRTAPAGWSTRSSCRRSNCSSTSSPSSRHPDSRTRTGPGWRRIRPMFTYADGRPIRPEYLTHRFRRDLPGTGTAADPAA
jgi:integrase